MLNKERIAEVVVERCVVAIHTDRRTSAEHFVEDTGGLLAGNHHLDLFARAEGKPLRELLRQPYRWLQEPRVIEVRPLPPSEVCLVLIDAEIPKKASAYVG